MNLILILLFIGVIISWAVFVYNNLISLANRTNEAWSDIDVELKRRADLIPKLIDTVKGYVKHEKEVLKEVTEARVSLVNANSLAEKAKANDNLSESLKSLFAVAEGYPQLRASENFNELQRELTNTENKIEYARRYYNGNVRDLNTNIQVFPYNLLANIFGFKTREFFTYTK